MLGFRLRMDSPWLCEAVNRPCLIGRHTQHYSRLQNWLTGLQANPVIHGLIQR